MNKIVVDHRTDSFNYPYFIQLEICKLNLQFKRPRRKTRVVNIYNNQVKIGCI